MLDFCGVIIVTIRFDSFTWHPWKNNLNWEEPSTKGGPSGPSWTSVVFELHPWRLTWNIIMEVWKIIFLSKWVICRFHVNLPGCMYVWGNRSGWEVERIHICSWPLFVGFSITMQLVFPRYVKNNANNSLANQHGNGKWICRRCIPYLTCGTFHCDQFCVL